jgi:peptidoglycan/xylan/chitin deacetylase (PgdA/CDA1 family)
VRPTKRFVLLAAVVLLTAPVFSEALAQGHPSARVARWYGNKAAAVSLRFDDSLDSHVTYVIPKLNQYGFKATFMINPGLDRYQKNKEFWETQVPRMGHELGNHTMQHRGARTPEEADVEIGEVSRLIWKLYPHKSKLTVYASGGGVKWGGKDWEDASPDYRAFVEKYSLIDLYDGHHPQMNPESKHEGEDFIGSVRRAIEEGGYRHLAFHHVGAPSLVDRLKTFYSGWDGTLNVKAFERGLAFLVEKRDILWIAPLGDVLKYEAERDGARVNVLSSSRKGLRLALTVNTDGQLYDQDLTLVVAPAEEQIVKSIVQGDRGIDNFTHGKEGILFNVRPVSGTIEILFQ